MIQSGASYYLYVVFLFLSTGAMILNVDSRIQKKANNRRDGKYAFFLGWFNILSGILLWVGSWAFKTFVAQG